ncbi:putative 40S ribosomal protein S10-B [Cercophora scortea]|uniref:40S ribosomal protein S10-B n=1 Tax=Cercophora scortea TaxID=314031 RepID=A0AAE0M6T7_9PEZI|nr:putative 40S ribosomal protein S10-B [Cercophora scortea]
MLIPKSDRKAIHEYLFREGVMVAEKKYSIHETGIRNLFVIKALQSLTSRGYVKTQFSWQWYYYTLTPEGLDYLREWLHLPAEIVPATHIKQQRSHAPPRGMMGEETRERRFGGEGRGGRGGGRGGGDREGGYRRRDAGEGKEGGAPGDFAPSFRGGFGRGAGRGGRGEAPPS